MGHKNVRYVSSISNRDQGGGVKKQGLPSTVGKSALHARLITKRASSNQKTPESSSVVIGVATDGPVSDATVRLINAETNVVLAETTTNSLGRYTFNVPELPDTFRIETVANTGTDTITLLSDIPKLSGIFRKTTDDLNSANVNIMTSLVSSIDPSGENIDNAITKVRQLSTTSNTLNIYRNFISENDNDLLTLNQQLFIMRNIKGGPIDALANALNTAAVTDIDTLATAYLGDATGDKNIFDAFNTFITSYDDNNDSFITRVQDSYKLTVVSQNTSKIGTDVNTISENIKKEKFRVKLDKINEALLKPVSLSDKNITKLGVNASGEEVYSLTENILLNSEKLIIGMGEILIINGAGSISSGDLPKDIGGYIENNGKIIIESGGQLFSRNKGKFIVNNGDIYVNGGKITTFFNDTIENNEDGRIYILNSGEIVIMAVEGTIINFGYILNNGNIRSSIAIQPKVIVNYDTIDNYYNGKLYVNDAPANNRINDEGLVFNIDSGVLSNKVVNASNEATIAGIVSEISSMKNIITSS